MAYRTPGDPLIPLQTVPVEEEDRLGLQIGRILSELAQDAGIPEADALISGDQLDEGRIVYDKFSGRTR
jgi:hypothetical protein